MTEKIDGTNAQVWIGENGEFRCGSRNRWITPEQDNYGFAAWAYDSKDELLELGPGRHFGEWWGLGIQRGYGQPVKRFSLFNTQRWNAVNPPPECCDVVPVLGIHENMHELVNTALSDLRDYGSKAAPGFMDPEGIVVYMPQAKQMFKVTLKNDGVPKGLVTA